LFHIVKSEKMEKIILFVSLYIMSVIGRTTTNLFQYGNINTSSIKIVNSGIGFTFVDASNNFVMNIDGSTRTLNVQNINVLGSSNISYTSFSVDPGLDGYTFSLLGTGSNMWYNTVDSSISFRVGFSSAIFKIQNSGVTASRYSAEPGSATNPSYTFSTDPDTGLYRQASDSISITTGGIERFNVNNLFISAYLPVIANNLISCTDLVASGKITGDGIRVSNGTLTDPSYSFVSETKTGMLLVDSNTIGITVNGTNVFKLTPTNLQSTVQFLSVVGSLTVPSYAFVESANTGIYSPATDTFAVVNAGIQSLKTDSKNNVIIGNETALLTSSNAGFLYIPSVSGTPVTAPVNSYTGKVPISYDTKDDLLNVYNSGWNQIKTGYWHIEANLPASSTFLGDEFKGTTYYSITIMGNVLTGFLRIRWTAKGSLLSGILKTQFVLPDFPQQLLDLIGSINSIPVHIGYKEGIDPGTQLSAVADVIPVFSNTILSITYLTYSTTASNPPGGISNSEIASDGILTLSFHYPIATLADLDPAPSV